MIFTFKSTYSFRATAITDDIRRLRPPRHIPIDSVIQPYVAHEAEGMQLLQVSDRANHLPPSSTSRR